MRFALWTTQALLAALFLAAGSMKLLTPSDQLTQLVPLPVLLTKCVGAAECLGAIGLILPGLLKIRPELTILAAAELVHIMIGATIVTLVIADPLSAVMPLAVGALCAFVAYGRSRLALHAAPQRRIRHQVSRLPAAA
jgi:uncharacterized membrane protein YphA (DoxX/SURF4 family)